MAALPCGPDPSLVANVVHVAHIHFGIRRVTHGNLRRVAVALVVHHRLDIEILPWHRAVFVVRENERDVR
ncbi:hypothetical protein, partial [Pseudomonas aeruginosa]|uniref:hypothetical protein n=1 Tax=Pseudomonas aeruginosa TaxID=287 RepID=UPI003CF778F1